MEKWQNAAKHRSGSHLSKICVIFHNESYIKNLVFLCNIGKRILKNIDNLNFKYNICVVKQKCRVMTFTFKSI